MHSGHIVDIIMIMSFLASHSNKICITSCLNTVNLAAMSILLYPGTSRLWRGSEWHRTYLDMVVTWQYSTTVVVVDIHCLGLAMLYHVHNMWECLVTCMWSGVGLVCIYVNCALECELWDMLYDMWPGVVHVIDMWPGVVHGLEWYMSQTCGLEW